ncbi:MAG: ATP-binding cassette domain-containing protein [Succinivibrionaceae bacterium]
MKDLIVEVEDFVYKYEDFSIILPEFKISRGEFKAIVGASGSGKSTILECLGLVRNKYQAKKFKMLGMDILKIKDEQAKLANLRGTVLGFMPQTGGLLPFLTVKDNIKLVQDFAKKYSFGVNDLCKTLGIEHLLNKYPHELSIGQRQRAVFVKSIAYEPQFLLIDEPTSALDPHNACLLVSEIKKTTVKYGIGAVIVTHDIDLVLDIPRYKIDGNSTYDDKAVFLESI